MTQFRIDPTIEIERICAFILSEVTRRRAHGVVLGLSGGLDSSTCAYLCTRVLPREQIHLFSLPERDSSTTIHNHARAVAQALSLPLVEENLTGLFDQVGLYRQAPQELVGNRRLFERSIHILRLLSGKPALYPWAQEYAFGRRSGFLSRVIQRWFWRQAGRSAQFIFGKVRTRMLILSLKALEMDCLQICTTDRSEWSVGFYDPHGDGVGDIAPLLHLYKTQIRQVARALGVPEEVLAQPSSGDLAAGLPNETAIGLSYETLDRVLVGMSLGMGDAEIAAAAEVQRSMVGSVRSACNLADERRGMPVRLPTSV